MVFKIRHHSLLRMFFVGSLFVTLPLAAHKDAAIPATPLKESACRFFPPNQLKFPVRPSGQISEMTVNRILQVTQQVYSPLFRQAGFAPLRLMSRWQDDSVNAFAIPCNQPGYLGHPQYPKECQLMRTADDVITPFSLVVLFGGLARHPLMTPEGLVLVACHEIGHHLGGFPRYKNNTAWGSTEGQSDYFATAKCARRIFAALGQNAAWAQRAPVPLDVRVQCQASFPQSAEQAGICMRSALGGLSLARVLSTARGADPRVIDFRNKNQNAVPVTFEGHPPRDRFPQ
ncbi:MAG: hypothetical protein KF865_01005 [Bdellovibrionaceae bacterium]|nr:hypothetical protein [Pseudobdellovibrionaceae bacterium]